MHSRKYTDLLRQQQKKGNKTKNSGRRYLILTYPHSLISQCPNFRLHKNFNKAVTLTFTEPSVSADAYWLTLFIWNYDSHADSTDLPLQTTCFLISNRSHRKHFCSNQPMARRRKKTVMLNPFWKWFNRNISNSKQLPVGKGWKLLSYNLWVNHTNTFIWPKCILN